jgi:hypothetical protein
MSDSIYTIHVSPEYKDFARALLATISVLIVLHLLMSDQKKMGIVGGLFNDPFSDTFSKILVSIASYYLVVKKIISIE